MIFNFSAKDNKCHKTEHCNFKETSQRSIFEEISAIHNDKSMWKCFVNSTEMSRAVFYLPRFKISKWDCQSTKICDTTSLFSNKMEIIKWDRKYQDCHWFIRDYKGLPFFQAIRDVILFWFGRAPTGQKETFSWSESNVAETLMKPVIWNFVARRVTETTILSWQLSW